MNTTHNTSNTRNLTAMSSSGINTSSNYQRNVISDFSMLPFKPIKILFMDELKSHHQDFMVFETKDHDTAVIISTSAANRVEPIINKYRLEATRQLRSDKTRTFYVNPGVLIEAKTRVSVDEGVVDRDTMIKKFDNMISHSVSEKVSDIRITVTGIEATISFKRFGEYREYKKISSEEARRLINAVYNAKGKEGQKAKEFSANKKMQTILERMINGHKYRIRFASTNIESPDYHVNEKFTECFNVALRNLPTDRRDIRPLDQLGFEPDQLALLKKAQAAPKGATISSGPTGSGKSTMMASHMSQIYQRFKGRKNFLTIEDPVEYVIPGFIQIPINCPVDATEELKAKLFIEAIITALRSDMDVGFCNEIRDKTTAVLAQKIIQSGHTFLSTIHANNALGIVDRLIFEGAEREIVCGSGFINLLINQALVGTVCSQCSDDIDAFTGRVNRSTDALFKQEAFDLLARIDMVMKRYQLDSDLKHQLRFRNESGCAHCADGVTGMTIVAEVIKPTTRVLQCLLKRESINAWQEWRRSGGRTKAEHGLLKVFRGEVCPTLFENALGDIDTLEIDDDVFEPSFFAPFLSSLSSLSSLKSPASSNATAEARSPIHHEDDKAVDDLDSFDSFESLHDQNIDTATSQISQTRQIRQVIA
ncbi:MULTISPECIES: GspE/PulE family protein [Cysteiniphilum]|uniref:Bacterial type II secretion system protein E domain-containing protein n=1 Tax=Cysteiniphilum litorale TaxID=2056700 RepID=A0A8J2Z4U0_9GAMM|nr:MULTISPECIES: ATPase, T2SS/T4P/T4SS family [Cysteiniphilum]GGF99254.1 hypothetical protein GCM10010995_15650 [Cysteiniphilum litorale]